MLKKLICCVTAAALSLAAAFAQQQTVSGNVKDTSGEPVPGAAVFYKGTSTATMTDADGHFSIGLQKGKVLVISCFGLKEKEITVTDARVLDIVLETDSMTIDDAVVIGYGTVSRKDLTGSISSVKADELMKAGSSNALGALQGKVAGLSITSQSGEPGSGFSIKIRGNNSINAGSTPLFVIDGMQMDISSSEVASSTATGSGSYDPMSFLNPADVESIEILKDASATAIYGARGANGVVIITTKSGATGYDQTLINFDSNFSLSENPSYIEMLGPQDYINYRFGRKDYGYYSFGVDTDGDGIQDTPENADGYEYYDWQKIMYRKAFGQSYNVSLSSMVGGSTQIAASLGYLDQQGLIHNNDQSRYTARIKLDHKVNKKLKVGGVVNYGRTISTGAVSSGGGSLGYSGLVQYIYLERPIEKWTGDEADEYEGIPFGLLSLITDQTYRKTTYDRLTANAYANWDITKNLSFRANASGGISSSSLLEYYSSLSKWGRSRNGKATNRNIQTYNYNLTAQLNYKKSWKKTHNLDAMVAGEITYYNSSNMTVSGYNFTDESTGAFNIGKAGIIEAPDQSISDNAKMSFISRVAYNYRQKYYITGTLRADGSSKFYAGNRVGWFPSASLAWRISEEPWMQNVKWMDEFKLRLSAGASGNDRVGNYAALATLGTNYYSASGTEIMGMAPTASANPKLKWETTYQYDAGVDLTLLKEKINLTADVYYKDTRDMLYQATLSAQSGFTTQWQNLGRVENKGIEIALTTHNIDTRSFSWSTNFTFDLSRNKVLDIGGIEYTMVNIGNGMLSSDISRIMVGQPIGIGWGYLSDGNYQLEDFVITDKNGREIPAEAVTSKNLGNYKYTLREGVVAIAGKEVQPGDRKYKDIYGDDNIITTEDRTKISDSNPKFSIGFGNTFSYKNFDLNIFLEGVYGRQILNEFKLRSESGESGGTQNNNLTKAAWDGHWTPENRSQTYSRLRNQTNTYCSDYYVEDGSYLRIKTVALGYSLGKKVLDKIHIRSARVAFNIDNLFCFSSYSGNDPDVSSSNSLFTGFDRMSYPKARTYSLSLNIGF